MRHVAPAALLVGSLIVASCGAPQSEAPADPILTQRLRDTKPRSLAPVLVSWLHNPKFEARDNAPELTWTKEGHPQFARPWDLEHMWWIVDENGFRTLLELESIPDGESLWRREDPYDGFSLRIDGLGKEWGRELACYKQKGDMTYDERRIFRVFRSSPLTELSFVATVKVFETSPDLTVGDLLEHLGTRYGTFEALCARIADHLASVKKE